MRPRHLIVALAFLLPMNAAAETVDEEAILAIIDRFFLALYRADADDFAAIVSPDAQTVIIHPEGHDPQVELRATIETVDRLRNDDYRPFRESYWSPTVLQRGRLATAWVPYTLETEAGFSHCGIDQFSLSKPDTKWVIDFIAFTIEPTLDACAELGRPSDASKMRPRFGADSR